MPAINLSEYKIESSILKLIPADMAKKYLILPVARVGATLTITMADPSNVFAIDDVKFMTGYNVEVVVSSESAIIKGISSYYLGKGDGMVTTTEAPLPKQRFPLRQRIIPLALRTWRQAISIQADLMMRARALM